MAHPSPYRYKQVIVVNKRLGMSKGKIGAQVAHAAMGVVLAEHNAFSNKFEFLGTYDEWRNSKEIQDQTVWLALNTKANTNIAEWLLNSFAKVVLAVESNEELLALQEHARKLGLAEMLCIDNGTTHFNNVPTATCIAFAPTDADTNFELTGQLKIL